MHLNIAMELPFEKRMAGDTFHLACVSPHFLSPSQPTFTPTPLKATFSPYLPEPWRTAKCVTYLVREVAAGWEFKTLHATTASFVFVCIFVHVTRILSRCSHSEADQLVTLYQRLVNVV
ncbi:putative cytochrome protein B [Toxoplasma gondii VAND]|uniref:Putative cytochrome protein B n=1 Tax=Toxoplasma gondii VAND TaxID=933077 RepID=A0A086PG49_TOXGO|nr:putative cytochrome protein B [Toxoplasma gondii VAND]